jgi:hypothetical protein
MSRRQARMRKPRLPHRARRVHGPAAAFAGYKNGTSSIACFFSFFFPFQQPQSLYLRDARCSRFMRIRPFCLESYPFPPGSPDRPCRSWEDRARKVPGWLQPESAIAPYSFDAAEQLWCRFPSHSASHWPIYELGSDQTLPRSALSSHHYRSL